MADTDYNGEISPWGVREGGRKSKRGKKGEQGRDADRGYTGP